VLRKRKSFIVIRVICFRLVNSCGRNGMGLEAVEIYRRMPTDLRNTVTDVCVLNACSHSGLVDEAQSIFNKINNKIEQIFTTMVNISCWRSMSRISS
jgi:pentatricopeptide repeat protein